MELRAHIVRASVAVMALTAHVAGVADDTTAPAFQAAIAPLLADRCGSCHGPHTAESGFRIDERALAVAGGDSGATGIVPGRPDASELIIRVSTTDDALRMPANGPPLTADEQAILKAWVAAGAVWPDTMESLASLLPADAVKPERGRDHWAFQPVVRPPVPRAASGTGPIDAFLQDALSARGLAMNAEADPRTLIRRLHFDLIGLPPSPEEITAFEDACRIAGDIDRPYRELTDRLLASPHYGERWARHWLDVVRFAESNGFEMNTPRPNAWPYRDWVIESLNADKPYDQFVKEQLYGDQLGADAATGFMVGGPKDEVSSPDPVLTANQRADELHDMVSTTGSAFLGLTVGCARCHDHKFDPIPQRDYYRVKSVFAGVKHADRDILSPDHADRLQKIASLERELIAIRLRLSIRRRIAEFQSDAPTVAVSGSEHLDLAEMESLSTAATDLTQQLERLKAIPKVYAGQFVAPAKTHRFHRGDPMQPRDEVAPGSLTKFGPTWQLPNDASETDRRRSLADWIASDANPLTARVIVNRLWHHHFGMGIVDTPSDLGVNGGLPSHPALLDWLASELVDPAQPAERWRLKRIHRLIVTSHAYRQTSLARPDALAADSGSRLLWRYPPRRLEAEPLRDAILAVSGSLNPRMGGPGFDLFEPNTNYVKIYNTKTTFTEDDFRRMVYQSKPRAELDSFFGAFDCPDAGQVQPKRTVSTTPLQALNMLNGDFLIDQARRFATRVESEMGSEPVLQVGRAVEIAFGRKATDEELSDGTSLVTAHGLPILCRSLYNASEFITIY